jgi:hypothetical protein
VSSNKPVLAGIDKSNRMPIGLGVVGLISAVGVGGWIGAIVGLPLMVAAGVLAYQAHQKREAEAFEQQALRVFREVGTGEVTREDLIMHMSMTPTTADKTLTWLVSHNLLVVDYSEDADTMTYRAKSSARPEKPSSEFDDQMSGSAKDATEERELDALRAATDARAKTRRDRQAAAELEAQRHADAAARKAEKAARLAKAEQAEAAKAAQSAFDSRLEAAKKNAPAPAKPAPAKPAPAKPAPAKPAPAKPADSLSDFDTAFMADQPAQTPAREDASGFDAAFFKDKSD